MIGSYEQGGLKDIDIISRIKALKLSWIKRLFDDSEHAWKIIPKLFFQSYHQEIFYPNLKITPKKDLPIFYKEIIKEWEDISKCDPQTIKSVLHQTIRFNALILIGNKPISWKLPNVCYVMDLYDNNGIMLEWSSFKNKFNLENKEYFKWRQIITAIPNRWKTIISQNRQFYDYSESPQQHLLYVTRMLFLDRLSSKELYTIMINKIRENPSSENTIENRLNKRDIEWVKVYTLASKITIDSHSRQFHFKLTHNILYLNNSLTHMGILANSLCSFCGLEEETPIHLFSQCRKIVSLWVRLRLVFNEAFYLPDLNPQSAILGFYEIIENKIMINQIHLTFKMTVYKAREKKICTLAMIIGKLRLIMKIEDNISFSDERKRNYNSQKWARMRSILEST